MIITMTRVIKMMTKIMIRKMIMMTVMRENVEKMGCIGGLSPHFLNFINTKYRFT